MKIRSFRDLLVWQKAMVVVTSVYGISRSFPSEEVFCLTSQMRRSAISVPSNIAEGFGRNSTSDYVRFLRIACGSLYELQTQLEIAVNLKYVSKENLEKAIDQMSEVERMLNSLIGKLVHK